MKQPIVWPVDFDTSGESRPGHPDGAIAAQVQCPNCCRMAPVIGRSMGLLFHRCELCGTTGAAPEPGPEPDR